MVLNHCRSFSQSLYFFLHLIKILFFLSKINDYFFSSFPWFHPSLSLITQPTFILFHKKFTDHNPLPFSFTISQIKNFKYHTHLHFLSRFYRLKTSHITTQRHRSQTTFTFILFHRFTNHNPNSFSFTKSFTNHNQSSEIMITTHLPTKKSNHPSSLRSVKTHFHHELRTAMANKRSKRI